MRVLFWGTHDMGKPRIRILSAGMLAVGIDLEEIHAAVQNEVSAAGTGITDTINKNGKA